MTTGTITSSGTIRDVPVMLDPRLSYTNLATFTRTYTVTAAETLEGRKSTKEDPGKS